MQDEPITKFNVNIQKEVKSCIIFKNFIKQVIQLITPKNEYNHVNL